MEIMERVVPVTSVETLNELYDNSAFTIEGFMVEESELKSLVKWISDHLEPPTGDFEHGMKPDYRIYITEGKTMNEVYGLTGSNAYQDDLHIVSIKLDDMKDDIPMSFYIERFSIGARWFDDIVENNKRCEEEKEAWMAYICEQCGAAYSNMSCGISIRVRGDVNLMTRHEVDELVEMNQSVALCPKCQEDFNKEVVGNILKLVGDASDGKLNLASLHEDVAE